LFVLVQRHVCILYLKAYSTERCYIPSYERTMWSSFSLAIRFCYDYVHQRVPRMVLWVMRFIEIYSLYRALLEKTPQASRFFSEATTVSRGEV